MWFLLACVDPSSESAAAPVAVEPWDWEDPGATEAGDLPASVLGAELTDAIADLPGFDPMLVLVTYEGIMASGDGTCPALDPGSTGRKYWEDDCTAESGSTFEGWVTWNWFQSIVDESGNPCTDDTFYFGFVRLTDPQGARFDGYGTFYHRACTEPDGTRTVDAFLEGDFAFTAAQGTFLATLQPVSLFWTSRDGGGEHELVLDGAMSGRTGDVAAVRFESLTITEGEPAGRVTVWDQGGHGYDLDFDGNGDGCAGEVCADWSPLTDWVGRPWY